jgi:tyrosine-protein phosphatase non-receptor type 4
MNVERGRVKCHQYWPDVGQSAKFDHLMLTCVAEKAVSSSFVMRNFSLTHSMAKEDVRQVCQMQYLSCPDHDIPTDNSDFLDFVTQVRLNRAGMVEPTVIHCSAGIGRTGVLIAMETAMCLIEANQPVNLPEIVRQMRDQRAMLIQTSDQYKFVCEAVLKVYFEHIIVPVDEFKS